MEYQLNASRRLASGLSDSNTAVYGMASGLKVSVDPYWVSLNAPLVIKDANNQFQYVGNNSTAKNRVVNAAASIINLYVDPSCFVATYDEDSFTNVSTAHLTFCEKRAAMSNTYIFNIERTSEQLSDISYGIVPMPMLDLNQGAYYSGMDDQVSALGILKTVTDDRLQMVGAVLECLASESKDTVVDEYYNNIMKSDFATDADAKEMLDIIYEGSCMSITAVYSGVLSSGIGRGITTFLRNIVIDGVMAGGQNPANISLSNINGHLRGNVIDLNNNMQAVRHVHSWVDGRIVTPATHTSEGRKELSCMTCTSKKYETVPMLTEHTYDEYIKQDDELHSKICDCGEKVYENHNWDDGKVTTIPIGEDDGVKTYTCLGCGHTKTESFKKTDESTDESTDGVTVDLHTPSDKDQADDEIKPGNIGCNMSAIGSFGALAAVVGIAAVTLRKKRDDEN